MSENTYPKLVTEYHVRYNAVSGYGVWAEIYAKGHRTTGVGILIEDNLSRNRAYAIRNLRMRERA